MRMTHKPAVLAQTLSLALALTMTVAACAGPHSQAVPQAARLSETVLTLTLSDGTVCRADWAAAGGAGRLADCGPGYDYSVTPVARPNPLRQVWVGLTAALGAEGLVPPMAEVTVTREGRSWRFASPPRVD